MNNNYNTKQSLKNNLLSMGIAFLICSPAFAEYGENKWKELNLTPEQKSQVKAIKQKYRREINREIEAVLNSEQKVKFQEMQSGYKTRRGQRNQDFNGEL